MNKTIEYLMNEICKKFKIERKEQKECISYIVDAVFKFNIFKTGHLSEEKVEAFLVLIGGFVSEIISISTSTNTIDYKNRLEQIKEEIIKGVNK